MIKEGGTATGALPIQIHPGQQTLLMEDMRTGQRVDTGVLLILFQADVALSLSVIGYLPISAQVAVAQVQVPLCVLDDGPCRAVERGYGKIFPVALHFQVIGFILFALDFLILVGVVQPV